MNKKTIIIVVLIALVLFFILKKFVLNKKQNVAPIGRPIKPTETTPTETTPTKEKAVLSSELTPVNTEPVSATVTIPVGTLEHVATLKYDDNGNPIEGEALFYTNMAQFGLYGFDTLTDSRSETVGTGVNSTKIINPSKLTPAEKVVFDFSKKLVLENKFTTPLSLKQLQALNSKGY